jgi:hypothetical protein
LSSRSAKSADKLFRAKSKADLKDKEEFREKKRVTMSSPNLRSLEPEDTLMTRGVGSLVRPCDCPDRENVPMAEILCRWDGLLVILVCAIVMMVVLSSPLSFLFGRRRNTQ